MKVLREILILLAGFGLYPVVQYITDRGEQQVAQACVKQQVKGKWSEASCARPKK